MKGQTNYGLLALVLVAILAGYLFLGGGKLSIGAPAPTPKQPTTPTAVGQCTSDGTLQVTLSAYESVIPTNGVKTAVNGAKMYIYASQDGQNWMTAPIATENITSGIASATGRFCNQYLRVFAGDGGYYLTQISPTNNVLSPATGAVVNLGTITLDKIGTITAEWDNGTAFRQVNPQITANPGTTNTDLTFDLKENSGQVVHSPAICFDYSPTYLSDIEVPGATKVTTPNRLSSTNGKLVCYDLGVDKVVNNQRTDKFTVKMDIKSSAPTNSTSSIGYTVMDKGTYLMNGQLKQGYEDYNDNDVGAPDFTGTITLNIPA